MKNHLYISRNSSLALIEGYHAANDRLIESYGDVVFWLEV